MEGGREEGERRGERERERGREIIMAMLGVLAGRSSEM